MGLTFTLNVVLCFFQCFDTVGWTWYHVYKTKDDQTISFTGRICPKSSSAGIVFTRSQADFWGLSPAAQGRHVIPIKMKFGMVEQIVGKLLPAKFHLDRFRDVGLRPPKIGILPIQLPLRGGSPARFLQNL